MTSLLLAAFLIHVVDPSALVTTAERSAFTKTGRYDEAVRLCDAYAAAWPARARCFTFGTTPEGRPMKALALSDDGVLDAATAKNKGRPVLFAEGGIHAGEIDGKDAGFVVARELLEGKLAPGVLGQLTFLFVPVFNVDGHERFGANNRPNQRGPEEMGWRTTSQNLNLNRDWAKADAPEMRAMLRLLAEWDPAVGLDLHVTDGAKFQHDVAIVVEPSLGGPSPVRETGYALRRSLVERLRKSGHKAVDFYPEFDKDDDPSSGFAVGIPPPRLFHGYWSVRNRIGILVETHSWKDYKTRVQATHDVLAAVLELGRSEVLRWRDAGLATDRAVEKGPGEVTLAWTNADDKTTIDFAGYAWTRTPSPISGGLRTIYDEKKPETWRVPFLPAVKPSVTAKAPGMGYLVPAAHAALIKERLDVHGIRSVALMQQAVIDADAFRATSAKFGERPYEGRMTAKLEGTWARERRTVPAGSLFVPVNQPLGRLVVHLFEPTGPDAFVSWGFFNASFEQKEYMEGYVAEEVAEEMLRDASVRKEFAARLESDAEFARDPEKRLEFFYRRHPSWDERRDLYPVLRVDSMPR